MNMFHSECGRNVNEFAKSMNAGYDKTKANKILKNFVHFSQFAVRRRMIVENINSKSICFLNHNVQVLG